MNYPKVIRIFLKLKCKEIVGILPDVAKSFATTAGGIALMMVLLLAFHALGWAVSLIFPWMQPTSTLPYAGIGVAILIFIALLLFVLWVIVMICIWIAENWRKAKSMANEN